MFSRWDYNHWYTCLGERWCEVGVIREKINNRHLKLFDCRGAVMDAIEAATKKSIELGQKKA